jgi:hypothetical protein
MSVLGCRRGFIRTASLDNPLSGVYDRPDLRDERDAANHLQMDQHWYQAFARQRIAVLVRSVETCES